MGSYCQIKRAFGLILNYFNGWLSNNYSSNCLRHSWLFGYTCSPSIHLDRWFPLQVFFFLIPVLIFPACQWLYVFYLCCIRLLHFASSNYANLGFLSQVSGSLSQVRSVVEEIELFITASSVRKQERTERVRTEDFDAEEARGRRWARKWTFWSSIMLKYLCMDLWFIIVWIIVFLNI